MVRLVTACILSVILLGCSRGRACPITEEVQNLIITKGDLIEEDTTYIDSTGKKWSIEVDRSDSSALVWKVSCSD